MDAQHKELFDLTYALECSADSSQRAAKLEALKARLFEYIQAHFAYEEDLMARLNYPKTKSHFHQHDAFRERFQAFKREAAKGAAVELPMANFLKTWLQHHIRFVDKELADFAKKQAAAASSSKNAKPSAATNFAFGEW